MPRSGRAKTKRSRRKAGPGTQDLFAEMMRLIKIAGSPPRKTKPAGTISQRTRLARLQKALSSGATIDALAKVRQLIPDDGAGVQQVVVYGFACILETSSARLSILFDRFDDTELRKIGASLESIGATRTLAALRRLQKAFQRAITQGHPRLDAARLVTGPPDTRKLDQQSEAYVDEMQQKLVQFCKAHVQDLAAGERR